MPAIVVCILHYNLRSHDLHTWMHAVSFSFLRANAFPDSATNEQHEKMLLMELPTKSGSRNLPQMMFALST